jgi:hypothetical protein
MSVDVVEEGVDAFEQGGEVSGACGTGEEVEGAEAMKAGRGGMEPYWRVTTPARRSCRGWH